MKGDDSAAKKRRHDGAARDVSGKRPARARKAQAALDVSLIDRLLLNGMRKEITERNLSEAETARALKIKRQSVNHLMNKAKVVPVALVVRFGEWMGIDGDKLLGLKSVPFGSGNWMTNFRYASSTLIPQRWHRLSSTIDSRTHPSISCVPATPLLDSRSDSAP